MKVLLHLCYFIPLAVCIAIVFLNGGAAEVFHMFIFLLLLIGLIGSASAGFNGRTATAVISGISILISSAVLGHVWRLIGDDHVWLQVSFIAGCVVLAVAFITHNNKTLSKLQVFYYVPSVVFILFLIFSPSPTLAGITLLFLLMAWITVKGLNSMYSSTSIDENETKTQKRKLKIALSIFVFSIAWLYSDIIFAVARHTYRDFTSTWTAPEPLGLENWIDHAADGFTGGTGTRENPFLVSTPEQLAYLAKRVNTGTLETANVRILNDIDLAGKEWTPIGTRRHPFSGVMDGEGAVIYNLTIATAQDRQGLFGVIDDWGGGIINLTLIGVNIKGRDFVGGFVGAFSNGTIRNSSLMGTVEGRHFIGGLTGYGSFNRILYSAYLGNVKGEIYVGGLVGKHTINEGDRFLAFAYASMRIPPVILAENIVIATVSGRRYVGGLVGHSGRRTSINSGFFAGKIRGEVFSAGISGFFPSNLSISDSFVLLYDTPASANFAEIAHGNNHRIGHSNTLLHLNSTLLPAEDVEDSFLHFITSSRFEQMFGHHRLTNNVLDRLHHPFYVLDIPYGTEIPQNAPISIEIGGKGFSSSLESFLGGRFWVEGNYFKMYGSVRDIPKGIYAIPCSMDVYGRFETIWILLNVI